MINLKNRVWRGGEFFFTFDEKIFGAAKGGVKLGPRDRKKLSLNSELKLGWKKKIGAPRVHYKGGDPGKIYRLNQCGER